MKTKLLKSLLTIACLLCSIAVYAHEFEVDGIYYNITAENEVEVTYAGDSYSAVSNEYTGAVAIPETVTYSGITYNVTSIGSEAFYGCTGLTEVTIPNSVTSIGWRAFCDCTGLTEVTIPNSVTSIGSYAFRGCTGLTEVTIPNSVTSIGIEAFYGCTELTSVTIPNSVTSIGGNAFYNTPFYDNQPNGEVYFGSILYSYKGTMPDNTTINVKEGTTYISDYAFRSCTGLTEVTLPNSVTSIGSEAFRGCTRLTEITIPNSVTSIGSDAFAGCTGLTEVTIGNSVTSIGIYAFDNCTGLTEITIPNSVTSIGVGAFYNCTGLTEICVEATTPPTIYASTFYQVDKSIPVYVPAGCEEAYRSADYWSEFTNIQAIKEPDVIATSLTLDNDVLEMYIGDAVQLTATVLPDNTTNKVVTWTSSDNEVATVDENGNVTAVSIGTATITATTTDGSDLSASCIVTVLPILATAIELDQEAVSIIAEKSATLTATVLPGNTTNKAVVWSTSDENIATVEDGVVTAISVGTATITATTTDGSNLSATCEVTVEQKMVKLIMQNSYYNTVELFLLPGTEQKMRILAADVYYVLNSVVLNGENVTDEVVDGMYTTPALMEDAVLNISFDIPTAEDIPSVNSRIKAYGYRGDVVVTGCERGESIAVYDVDGILLRTIFATSDTMRIAMPTDAVYVVKVADAAVKVAL